MDGDGLLLARSAAVAGLRAMLQAHGATLASQTSAQVAGLIADYLPGCRLSSRAALCHAYDQGVTHALEQASGWTLESHEQIARLLVQRCHVRLPHARWSLQVWSLALGYPLPPAMPVELDPDRSSVSPIAHAMPAPPPIAIGPLQSPPRQSLPVQPLPVQSLPVQPPPVQPVHVVPFVAPQPASRSRRWLQAAAAVGALSASVAFGMVLGAGEPDTVPPPPDPGPRAGSSPGPGGISGGTPAHAGSPPGPGAGSGGTGHEEDKRSGGEGEQKRGDGTRRASNKNGKRVEPPVEPPVLDPPVSDPPVDEAPQGPTLVVPEPPTWNGEDQSQRGAKLPSNRPSPPGSNGLPPDPYWNGRNLRHDGVKLPAPLPPAPQKPGLPPSPMWNGRDLSKGGIKLPYQ